MLESDLPTISHPHQLTFIVDLLALISELMRSSLPESNPKGLQDAKRQTQAWSELEASHVMVTDGHHSGPTLSQPNQDGAKQPEAYDYLQPSHN